MGVWCRDCVDILRLWFDEVGRGGVDGRGVVVVKKVCGDGLVYRLLYGGRKLRDGLKGGARRVRSGFS